MFQKGNGLDKLRERLLLEESYTIYHLLGTVKLSRKIILRKLYTLSFKSLLWDWLSSSLGAWGYGQNLQPRYARLSVFLTNLSIWLTNVYFPSHTRNRFLKCYLQKWKVSSNFICKLQGGYLMKVSFKTYYIFRKGEGIFFINNFYTLNFEAKFGNHLDLVCV